jgi:Tfp pilus assembly protein PilF
MTKPFRGSNRPLHAKRYEPRHFPYFNLGRVYLAKGSINRARESIQQSLVLEPRYTLAAPGY